VTSKDEQRLAAYSAPLPLLIAFLMPAVKDQLTLLGRVGRQVTPWRGGPGSSIQAGSPAADIDHILAATVEGRASPTIADIMRPASDA